MQSIFFGTLPAISDYLPYVSTFSWQKGGLKQQVLILCSIYESTIMIRVTTLMTMIMVKIKTMIRRTMVVCCRVMCGIMMIRMIMIMLCIVMCDNNDENMSSPV